MEENILDFSMRTPPTPLLKDIVRNPEEIFNIDIEDEIVEESILKLLNLDYLNNKKCILLDSQHSAISVLLKQNKGRKFITPLMTLSEQNVENHTEETDQIQISNPQVRIPNEWETQQLTIGMVDTQMQPCRQNNRKFVYDITNTLNPNQSNEGVSLVQVVGESNQMNIPLIIIWSANECFLGKHGSLCGLIMVNCDEDQKKEIEEISKQYSQQLNTVSKILTQKCSNQMVQMTPMPSSMVIMRQQEWMTMNLNRIQTDLFISLQNAFSGDQGFEVQKSYNSRYGEIIQTEQNEVNNSEQSEEDVMRRLEQKINNFQMQLKEQKIGCECFIREKQIVFRVNLMMNEKLRIDEEKKLRLDERLDIITMQSELQRKMSTMLELYEEY